MNEKGTDRKSNRLAMMMIPGIGWVVMALFSIGSVVFRDSEMGGGSDLLLLIVPLFVAWVFHKSGVALLRADRQVPTGSPS